MKEPIVDLKKIAAAGKKAAFSTETHTKGEIPTILHELKQKFTKARSDCAVVIQDKVLLLEKGPIQKWDDISEPKDIKQDLTTKISTFLNFTPEKFRAIIKTPYANYKKRLDNLKEFKRQNNRTFEPIRADNKNLAWFIVLALFSIEVAANFQLFQGVTGTHAAGTREAWVLSGAQSFANVVTGFMVGSLLWGKVLFAPTLGKRLFALFLSLSHAALIVWMNLSIGLWRAIITTNAEEGTKHSRMEAMDPFSNFLFFNGQLDAMLVSIVGLVFAVIAYLDGWFSDDPYPQYGARAREVTKARKVLNESTSALYENWELSIKTYQLAANESSKDGHKALSAWSNAVNLIQKEFVDWSAAIIAAEKSYLLATQTYETAFNKSLEKGSEKLSLPKNALWPDKAQTDPLKVFDDFAYHYLTDNARKKEFKKRKDEYVASFNKLTQEWDKHQKETTLALHKLAKEFDE